MANAELRCAGSAEIWAEEHLRPTGKGILAEFRGTNFWILISLRFPSKTAIPASDQFFSTPMIPNLYGAILNFTGFFWSDPLPTPDFCRNMA
jgi:hypothetical protein